MDEKQFGVKTCLVNELRRFQSNLKRKRAAMPFREYANTCVNDSPVTIQRLIIANEGTLSLIPSNFEPAFRPPKQVLGELSDYAVKVEIEPGIEVTIIFDKVDHKTRFQTAMGDLNRSSSTDSSEEENN